MSANAASSAPRGTGALVVFAKWPAAGAVKTRLCPPFTPEQAAAFYDAMLGDVLDAMARLAPPLGLELVLAAHPHEALGRFAERAPGWRIVAQEGADLSARMEHAAASELARGAARVLLRGSDNPALDAGVLAAALAALERCDVALSPDRDGGYGLVALRRFAPGMFAHAMSTATVLSDTRAAARALGMTSELLAPCFDVDTAADLELLRAARPRAAALCPRTYAWLDANAL
ncbi:MAG TPA: TIGR04282 family arsenosugar biosynthesis glycosyltransferase [Myxococcota bacterium]|nr:TIGR04282 family arsenosugar biosynthesis glycosyltransferase [Myxococcota bacterium]